MNKLAYYEKKITNNLDIDIFELVNNINEYIFFQIHRKEENPKSQENLYTYLISK